MSKKKVAPRKSAKPVAKRAYTRRNPKAQDATLINIDALKTRVEHLEADIVGAYEKLAILNLWRVETANTSKANATAIKDIQDLLN